MTLGLVLENVLELVRVVECDAYGIFEDNGADDGVSDDIFDEITDGEALASGRGVVVPESTRKL